MNTESVMTYPCLSEEDVFPEGVTVMLSSTGGKMELSWVEFGEELLTAAKQSLFLSYFPCSCYLEAWIHIQERVNLVQEHITALSFLGTL